MTETLRPNDNPQTQGVKFDYRKTRYDLIPVEAIAALASILTHGADKYGDRNWEKGMDWSRPYGSLLRHLFSWWARENIDPESGKPHLWHAICNLAFLIAYEARDHGTDDRP